MKTRIIDLTSKNLTGKQDVKVEFKEKERSRLVGRNIAIYNIGMNFVQHIEKFEARPYEEIGFTGLVNERLVILCDLSDESLDKLVALENLFFNFKESLFRITEDEEKPQVSIVFTGLPYSYVDGTYRAKSVKISDILKCKDLLKDYIQIVFTAVGDYNAPIGLMDYNKRKVYVNVHSSFIGNTVGFPSPVVVPVQVVNPVSDILYSMVNHSLLDEYETVLFSPSICSSHSKAYLEDTFIDKMTVTSPKQMTKLIMDGVKSIACVTTSINDFMSFCDDLVVDSSIYWGSDGNVKDKDKIKLGLFINFTPEKANCQEFYSIFYNFMNFIENRIPTLDVTFYVSDIESAGFANIDSKLLKYVPVNIELYHTKILETLCC